MSQEDWERFQTKLSGCFYASVVAVGLGIIVSCFVEWCSR